MKEIEFKFKPNDKFNLEYIQNNSEKISIIKQGYIGEGDTFIYRVRMSENFNNFKDFNNKTNSKLLSYLTIKEKTAGSTRIEIEKDLSKEEALILLSKEEKKIEKIRYTIPYKGFNWEVDVFEGDNKGLITIEIEVPDKDTVFDIPEWIGDNITHESRYYNHSLLHYPYSKFNS